MMMIDQMMMMMIFGAMIGLLIIRAELEEMRQRGEEEEQELEQQLFGSPHANHNGQQPEQLDLYDLDDQHQGNERQQQFVAQKFVYGNESCT